MPTVPYSSGLVPGTGIRGVPVSSEPGCHTYVMQEHITHTIFRHTFGIGDQSPTSLMSQTFLITQGNQTVFHIGPFAK